ncbi:MAG: hypothetical protein GXP63_01825 [DPANN group archaeon]|nr:hypothetical protein [DPANN group archaeon]
MINIITLAGQRINLRLDPHDHARAKAIAAVKGLNLQEYLRDALQDHIKRQATTHKIGQRQHPA